MERFLPFARLRARLANQSLPIRGTTLLMPDHPQVIGIVPIRVSGDEHIQAVAFGLLDQPPEVAFVADPYDLHEPGLARLGECLHAYLHDPQGCQVWLPDVPSLRALIIEGLRNRLNTRCAGWRRQLGVCGHALGRLHPLAGQQIVVVATELLGMHLVTGLSPLEETHLGARLAFDAPRGSEKPVAVAANRWCESGPSLLPLDGDNMMDAARPRLKAGTARLCDDWILDVYGSLAAENSWNLLAQARAAFRALSLPPLPGLEELEADTQRELTWLLARAPDYPHHLGRSCAEFRKREYWRARLEDLNARGDPVWREILRREGRVFAATVRQRPAGALFLETEQDVLRLRAGARLKTADGRVEAVVEMVQHPAAAVHVVVRVTKGKRAAAALSGATVDWCDTVVFSGSPPRIQDAYRLSGIPVARDLPPLAVPGDLLQLARSLRKP